MSIAKSDKETFILCVDDDKEFLNSLKLSLPGKINTAETELEYSFLFLDDPKEALEIIDELAEDEEDIALILTDQMMPHMKGVDFLREAKKTFPHTMRALLTGYAGLDSAVDAINENILHRYLTKPVSDINELAFTLQHLLNEYNLKDKVDEQKRIIMDLYDFANTLNSYTSLKNIFEHTLAFTRDTLQCERISMLILENDELTVKAGIGIPEGIIEKVRIPLGENVAGKVMKNREPILVKNIDEISWLDQKINKDYQSFISAPVICAELKSSNVPIGVINVTNKFDNAQFTNNDLRTLSFIANTASIAINNQKNRELLEQNYLETIKALVIALEARDEYTKGHSIRVMEYSECIAKKYDMDEERINRLKDAAILHDIGKIGVSDEVLLKPGKLDPAEFGEIKKHPGISNDIVMSIESLRLIAPIVRQHHEKFDGTGYPDGLKGEEISLEARIMAIADTYDAMTSNRPYRDSLDPKIAVEEIEKCSGTQFDPECVNAFIKCCHML